MAKATVKTIAVDFFDEVEKSQNCPYYPAACCFCGKNEAYHIGNSIFLPCGRKK